MADDRDLRQNDSDLTCDGAQRGGSDVAERAPDLELQFKLTELLADAQDVEPLAPDLLKLLVERLGLTAAELWLQCKGSEHAPLAGHWLVRAGARGAPSSDPTASSSGGRVGSSGMGATSTGGPPPPTPELHCSSELSSTIAGEGLAILRTYSAVPMPLALGTERFLRSVGRQLARFVEARAQAARCAVMAARQVVLLDTASEAAFTIDAEGRVLTLNATAEALFGVSSEVAVGSDLVDLIVPESRRALVRASLDRFRAERGPAAHEHRFETCALRHDRTEFPAALGLARLHPSSLLPLTVLVTDLSRRNAAQRRVEAYQKRLRSLTADLLLAEERERRQLALDLHDGLSQTIALVRMRVAALKSGATDVQVASLKEIEQLIEQANQAARSVSFELSPPVLHDLGLEPALEWLAENISSRYGLKVEFDHDERPKPTSEKTRIILFRSIRELLINAAKHAKAHLVKVKLERVGNELHVSVIDDGLGMATELEQAQGSGLFSIVERLHHVGGEMSIQSERGRGTYIKLRALIGDDSQLAPDPRFVDSARHAARGAMFGTKQGM